MSRFSMTQARQAVPARTGVLALAFALVALGAVGCSRGKQEQADGPPGPGAQAGQDDKSGKQDPVPVTVVEAVKRNVPVYLTALGTVTAYNAVTVTPQVSGELLSVNFKEGQKVAKGAVLAQIDPRTFKAQYDQAAAAKLQSQAQLATAQSNYERSNNPAYRQYVAQTDLTNLRNQVSQFQAAVASAQATMDQNKVQLGYTRITAPISGITGLRGVDAGNVVNTSSQIVTITQVQPIHVVFNLPEQDLDKVRSAQKLKPLETATLDRTDAHVINTDGTLQVIDNQISTTSGTFRLRAEFPNADDALWPGQFVNVRLKLSEVDGAVVVPAEAVSRGSAGDYVYLLKPDNTVTLRNVTQAGEADASHVVIGKGLVAGDRVVTEGQFRLKEGAKVNPLKPGQAPPEPTAEQLKAAGEKSGGRGRGGRGPR